MDCDFKLSQHLSSSYSIHLVLLRSQEMAPGLSSARQRRRCQGRPAAAASPSSPHLHISRRPLLYKPICICLHLLTPKRREITSSGQIRRFHLCSGFSLPSTSSGTLLHTCPLLCLFLRHPLSTSPSVCYTNSFILSPFLFPSL